MAGSNPAYSVATAAGDGVLTITPIFTTAPTLSSVNPTSGPVGASVTPTGTNLTGATGVKFNTTAATTFAVVNSTTVTATVPTGATSGNVTVTTGSGTSNGVAFTVITDLVVSTTTTIAAGTYATITINSPGVGTLAGNVIVTTSTTVGNGATLNDGCATLSGAGSFALAAGGTLGICAAAGISSSGTTGAIQNTGSRTFDVGANYTYNGTATQTTGSGLPATVRALTLANSTGLTLTSALTATTAATLTSGVLTTGANAPTLGSAATLSETATGYATGTVQTTRTLATAGTAKTFGGLGLTLTPSGTTLPGSTLVKRITGTARTGVGTSQSVKRTFDIQPTVKTGLNVALALTVRDDERNNIAAANLHLYKSDDNGATWQSQAGATYTTTAASGSQPTTYTASKSGISNFSIWTLGDATNPLPVQLVSFTAEAVGSAARLRWATASETDNDHFDIEASTDGRAFARLGTVAGHGSTLLPQQYAFTDEGIARYAAPLVYYRLRQVDRDGTSTYSAVRMVAVGKAGLALYPNPAGHAATLSGTAAGALVQVYDALGALVLTTTADTTGTVLLALPAALPGGLYLVRSGTAPALRLVVE